MALIWDGHTGGHTPTGRLRTGKNRVLTAETFFPLKADMTTSSSSQNPHMCASTSAETICCRVFLALTGFDF